MAGRTSDIAMGIVDSHELVTDGLPFAGSSTRGGLVAEVTWPLPHLYDEVLSDLDRLEGHQPERPEASFYLRTEVTVYTTQGDVQAWLYEAEERAGIGCGTCCVSTLRRATGHIVRLSKNGTPRPHVVHIRSQTPYRRRSAATTQLEINPSRDRVAEQPCHGDDLPEDGD